MEMKISDELNEEVIKQKNERIKRGQNRLLIGFAIVFFLGYVFFFSSNLWMPRSYEDIRITPLGSTVEANDRKITLLEWTYSEEQHLMEVMIDISNASVDGIDQYKWSALDRNEGMCEVEPVIESSNFAVLHLKRVPTRWTEISLRIDADSSIAEQNTASFQTIRLYTSKRAVDTVPTIEMKTEKEYRITACDLKIENCNTKIDQLSAEILELKQKAANADDRIAELEEELTYQTDSEKTDTFAQISTLQSTKSSTLSDIQSRESEIKEQLEKIEKQKELKASIQEGA